MEEEFEGMDDLEQIEMYCEGTMDANEKAAFEARLSYDSNLREELELYKNIVEGIKHAGKKKQKEKLKSIDNEIDSVEVFSKEEYKGKKNKLWIYGIAASFLVLATFIFYCCRHNSGNIENYEEEDIGLPVLMGNAGNAAFDRGMTFYKQAQFDSAISIFKNLYAMKPTDTIDYYIGVSEYGLKDYEQAKNCFSKFMSEYTFSQYKAKAEYRLGLCFWHMGEMKEAKVQFEAIANDRSNVYSDKAEAIIKKINP